MRLGLSHHLFMLASAEMCIIPLEPHRPSFHYFGVYIGPPSRSSLIPADLYSCFLNSKISSDRALRAMCAWECSPGRSLCLTKSSACGRLWQFAHPRPLSLLHVGEGTTRRGTATPVHRPQRPAGSTHSSTPGPRLPAVLHAPV